MKAAIQSGLYTDNSAILDLQPACSSGNCTWPSYRSLAICARSADVTSHLKQKTVLYNETTSAGVKDVITQWYLSELNYIIDDGLMLLSLKSSSARLKPIFGEIQSPSLLNISNSIAFQNSFTPVADIFVIYSNASYSSPTFQAVEFVLEWCVQNFTTSVTNGISSTERYASFRDFGKPSPDDVILFAAPNDGDNRYYSVDSGSHYSLQGYFQVLFQGTANWTSTKEPPVASNDATQAIFQAFDIFGTNGDGVGRVFGGAGLPGLKRMLDNVATGMTNL